jgi:hypothetical protein
MLNAQKCNNNNNNNNNNNHRYHFYIYLIEGYVRAISTLKSCCTTEEVP